MRSVAFRPFFEHMDALGPDPKLLLIGKFQPEESRQHPLEVDDHYWRPCSCILELCHWLVVRHLGYCVARILVGL